MRPQHNPKGRLADAVAKTLLVGRAKEALWEGYEFLTLPSLQWEAIKPGSSNKIWLRAQEDHLGFLIEVDCKGQEADIWWAPGPVPE